MTAQRQGAKYAVPLEPLPTTQLREHPELGPQYALCAQTGAIYWRLAEAMSYEQSYFTTEYREQYGRSYLEDEETLRRLARRRLAWICRCPLPGSRLLEIGAASGFFLDEARRIGFQVRGLEISRFAAKVARQRFGLDIACAAFPQYDIGRQRFDLIAAFYLLEHLPEQHSALKAIAAALRPGGLFAFAMPSLKGPSFQLRRQRWLKEHPKDHYVDHSPNSLRKTLAYYGLKLRFIQPASYHPERAGPLWRHPALHPLYRHYARRRIYGDTMEGLAERTDRS